MVGSSLKDPKATSFARHSNLLYLIPLRLKTFDLMPLVIAGSNKPIKDKIILL